MSMTSTMNMEEGTWKRKLPRRRVGKLGVGGWKLGVDASRERARPSGRERVDRHR